MRAWGHVFAHLSRRSRRVHGRDPIWTLSRQARFSLGFIQIEPLLAQRNRSSRRGERGTPEASRMQGGAGRASRVPLPPAAESGAAAASYAAAAIATALLYRDGIWRRGDTPDEMERHRHQHELVTFVVSAVGRELIEHELLTERKPEQRQRSIVERAGILESPRPRFDRRTVGADRGDPIVPQPFDHCAAVLDTAGLELRQIPHLALLIG